MKIRVYKKEDLNRVAQLFVETFGGAPWHEQWDVEVAYKRLEMHYNTPRFIGIIVEEYSEIVGVLMGNVEYWYDGNHFSTKELFIAPTAQGKGVGSFLMQELKHYLKVYDVVVEELLTLNTQQTIKFYEKQGYQIDSSIVQMRR